MTHSKCGECRNYFKCDSACKNDWACEDFEPQGKTLFDRITASPEVLAEKLVYPTYGIISRTWDFEKDDWGTAEPSWSSAVIPSDRCYSTKEDAIAATVARLKEVEK